MNHVTYTIHKFSKYFILSLFLFLIFFNHQAKADCFVDGVQFDIGGKTGSGVTAVDHGNPITVSEIRQWDTTGDDITKNVNGFDLKFNANHSLSENSDQAVNISLLRSF